ncbi:hypothetical protein HS1genome_0108 [Sulfodiicoccus acidiphilus]|uniref:ArnR1-like winged helix-turn-helix domain-containing protein n=1 Tax=Sulfodiicoccus acidiphilus TaxID=1670455 RepID=A0A348B0L7_9CREN|nr:hypothetical protein [Sulfodiicoccus acidiphilus]BBD71719.1 hypothetical protein HS1genome_0108 [Sulfodiicoccus acidiphilus]GGT86368.1 hypothetical protein GCM10007116_00380 [Sulfodiicoccus acidiphilus]
MEEIKSVLSAIRDGALNPGDVVVKTGLPRYEVLAVFHVLEGLGLIRQIYSKGSHKVFKLTDKGLEILQALEKGSNVTITVVVDQEEA